MRLEALAAKCHGLRIGIQPRKSACSDRLASGMGVQGERNPQVEAFREAKAPEHLVDSLVTELDTSKGPAAASCDDRPADPSAAALKGLISLRSRVVVSGHRMSRRRNRGKACKRPSSAQGSRLEYLC